MFELRYKSPSNSAVIDTQTDPDKVRFTVTGVQIRLTRQRWMLIPWSRVTAVIGDVGLMNSIVEATELM